MNGDGIVDIRDYGLWRQNFGSTDCGNLADLDTNCIVDIRDYGLWRQHFGDTLSSTLTPTPTSTAGITLSPNPTSTASITLSPTPTPIVTPSGTAIFTTDTGTNIIVGASDFNPTASYGVAVGFNVVTQPGLTRIDRLTSLPSLPPASFGTVINNTAFDISTSASYAGPIGVAIPYDPRLLQGADPSNLALLHYENGSWIDRTVLVTATRQVVQGQIPSLSPFVLTLKLPCVIACATPTPTISPGTLAPNNRKLLFVPGMIFSHDQRSIFETTQYASDTQNTFKGIRHHLAQPTSQRSFAYGEADMFYYSYSTTDTYLPADTRQALATSAARLGNMIDHWSQLGNYKFDIITDSLGGSVAAYWASTEASGSPRLAAVRSIIPLDSPVYGFVGDFDVRVVDLYLNDGGQAGRDLRTESQVSVMRAGYNNANIFTLENTLDKAVPQDAAILPGKGPSNCHPLLPECAKALSCWSVLELCHGDILANSSSGQAATFTFGNLDLILGSDVFARIPCPAPTLLTPTDGAILTSNTIAFSWSPPTGCTFSGYTFRIKTVATMDSGGTTIVDTGEGNTQHISTITGFDNQDLYWGVRTANPLSPNWAVRRFRVVPGGFAVTTPIDAPHTAPLDGNCTSTLVGNPCTLRAAVQAANYRGATGCPCTINVPAGTYVLTVAGVNEDAAATGDLDINGNVTIVGAGANSTILDGNGGTGIERVIELQPAANATIAGITIRNGVSGPLRHGGGIYNRGTLALRDVVITNNAALNGGGIANEVGGRLTITTSVISNNTATNAAAGIANNSSLVIDASTITGNRATGFSGGGISNSGGASLTISNSTISGNSAASEGAAIEILGPSTTAISSSTIGSNTALGGAAMAVYGTVTLRNSIVSNNGSVSGNCSGIITSEGSNLSSDNTCSFAALGDLNNTDPRLGLLQNNGGQTPTQALLAGSLAIDAVLNSCPPPATDQRGVPRPQGARCDMGAVESQ